ncbi:hypothetical protein Lfu02_05740 [Longispora fulva]|uniref:Uncharacterized membrane protein YoaK (UPF0700 family) n=1 Tax=Longispora fulva TaxID=619741 RepID=A0A8J7KH42_9ACTN|nr:anthrone oxygenase family protein [Longispora fulva]MBG6135559.1 uncharacterized membrane protein YoaK (UPF0700 family) [Longispora fulva]GIG56202.1 hypothetical protein Lfu02_05740 [Longispora fulva]
MFVLSHVFAAVAVLTAGIIYGTDVLGALVGRPTWAKVDDRALVAVNGHMHHYGDRRFPIPGALSVVATVLAAGASALSGRWPATAAALVATVALVVWLVIYKVVNAPINKELTAAALEGRVPANARALQTRWDSVITARALLQGVAVGALCAVLALP